MKAREFVRKYVIPAGGVLEKTAGDHHVFRFPNGATFDVPMGGKQSEAASWLLPKLRRLLRGGATVAVIGTVIVVFALLVGACSAPFTTTDSAADDGGTDAHIVATDAGSDPETSSAIEAGAMPESATVLPDAGDGGVQVMGDDAHTDASSEPEAGLDASPDARDAAPDVVDAGSHLDAAPDVAPSCADDLSNIAASNFHIAFDLLATGVQSDGPLVEQRATCGQYDVHWLIAAASGHIVIQFYDGAAGITLQSIATINDGVLHHVVVARVSGTISISIDGAVDNSSPNLVFAPGTLPLMQVGRSACTTAYPGQVTNACITRS